MVAVIALRRFLLLFALLGVLFAPASLGTAMATVASSADGQMEMAGMPETDAGMPCCPEEKPVKKPDCGKPCLLALVCSTSLVANLSPALEWTIDVALGDQIYAPMRESLHLSAISEPPARPPKA
ncbi:hypothetical protein [Rhizobium sp. LC145]|uniref:hypothetical protein n=1 Tax=Rhizobium sp. LC145 TaxID=1120688 RepID=UPI0006999357|nr:hypothetical protein [Rhizobium sp. LC145]TKT66196.1 hypothetical protein FDR95_06880 [Rhizobiaceae bacterium LC148]